MSSTGTRSRRQRGRRKPLTTASILTRLQALSQGKDLVRLGRAAQRAFNGLGEQRRFATNGAGQLWTNSPDLFEFLGIAQGEWNADRLADALEESGFPPRIRTILARPASAPVHIDRLQRDDGRTFEWMSLPLEEVGGRAWIVSDRTALARSEALQSALFRVSEISRDAKDLGTVLERIHRVVGELMDATNFYVAIFNEERGALEFPYFVDEEVPHAPSDAPLDGLTGWVLRRGEPLLVQPADFTRMMENGEIRDIGPASVDWLGVPLTSQDRTFGVIGIQSYRHEVRYSRRDLDILMFVGRHVASLIEQRRREAALRESEQRYRQFFDNNQAIKMVVDPSTGEIVDANPAACSFYGYPKENLCSKKIWEINTLPEDEVKTELGNAAARERGYFNFRHRLASGEVRDVEVHSGPVYAGGRLLLYSIVHDVTERRRAEKALRRSEEHFRTLIENASDMIAIVDVQGTIHYNSPSVQRVLGYKPHATIGINIFDYAHADDLEGVRRLLRQAAAGEPSDVIEMRIRHRDGSWRILEGVAHQLDEESERLVVNCRDVTVRKIQEQMLQTHAAAMEASVDGISIVDGRGRFSYVNQAFLHMFGFRKREELVGRRWSNAVPDSYAAEVRDSVIRPFLRRGEWRGEVEVRTASGMEMPAEASLYQIGNGSTVCVIRDITERNLAAEQIRYLAYHDSLTGLANRMNFQDRLLLDISRASREQRKVGLIYLDLDRFKSINDSKGHHFGDELLQEIGRRIRKASPGDFMVSRLGGDEFTVLLHRVDGREEVVSVAERILASVREPMTILGDEVTCTTSVGIALYPDDGTDADTLKRNADKAMYQAKEQGRDRYQIFNASLGAASLERIAIEGAMRRAADRDEFSLHFQPIVSLTTGRLHGFEALLRWNSAELGSVPPSAFIPVAEATGQMQAIGDWVLSTACRELAEWQSLGYTGISVAVNLSMTQLRHSGLAARVAASLEVARLEPMYLELEVTESGAMENPEAIIDEMMNLGELGVRISLDDFGIGHSSLSHLKRLPIHTLKIDQSFIRDLDRDPDTGTIVRAMIDMAHTLRLVVIAEGVETDPQRMFLREHRCDYLQGYLFSRPIPAERVPEFIAQHNLQTGQWS